MDMGALIGPSFIDFRGEGADTEGGESLLRYGPSTGMAGASASFGLKSDWFRIQIDILQASKGANLNESLTGATGSFLLRYLEIPLLLRGDYPLTKVFRIYGLSGIGFGFLRDAKSGADGAKPVDRRSELQTLDIGVITGLGVEYKLWPERVIPHTSVTFELRGEFGSRSIGKSADLRNLTISLLLGFRFDLSRRPGQADDPALSAVTNHNGEESDPTAGENPVRNSQGAPGNHHGNSDNDSDKDGIPDNKDECPYLVEDRNGFEDTDGCPDGDRDKDDLAVPRDRCPAERAMTWDGCARQYVYIQIDNSKVALDDVVLTITRPILFKKDKKPTGVRHFVDADHAGKVMNEIAQMMSDYPQIHLQITSPVCIEKKPTGALRASDIHKRLATRAIDKARLVDGGSPVLPSGPTEECRVDFTILKNETASPSR